MKKKEQSWEEESLSCILQSCDPPDSCFSGLEGPNPRATCLLHESVTPRLHTPFSRGLALVVVLRVQ